MLLIVDYLDVRDCSDIISYRKETFVYSLEEHATVLYFYNFL